MNYKELCDFKTINESIELKKQKGNIQKEDDKEYVCNSKNENAKNIEQLLNNISKSLHNRGRKDKFKRVWTSFLGFWSDKAGQYSANLNKALQEVREYVKEILDGNPRFQIDFESRDAVIEDYLDYNRIFPRYITYYKKDGANDEKDGTKSFKIWASDIQDFFDNYSNNRKSVISAIKSLKGNLEEKKAIKDDIKNTRRAIEILQDCLDRGIWIAAAALLSNIEKKKEDMVAVINESYLPLARTYQVLDGIGEEAASLQKAIKDADIPFFSKELDAVNKHCKDKGVNLKVAIETLTLKPKNDKTDQEVEDLEILENLKQKISASKAAYDLRSAKCNSVSTGDNIKEIAEYGDNAKYDPSEKNAVVRMANKEIKKKQSKIRLGVFISIVIFFLVVAIFSAFKPGIKYAIGREIVAEVDGCEYTYRKFDDTGVEIVSAKMLEGISEYTVIPEIDGHKVVAISEGVFADYTDFESVYIGKDIVEVGSNAFARKDNARITIYCEAQAKPDAWAKDWANDNVVVWGWTDSQQNIEITWGNLRFAIDKGKEQAAILGLSSEAKSDEVDEIEIPSNVTYESEEYAVVRVADEAFKDAAYICKIVFEEENNAITDIGFGAFEGCSSLTDIAIPFVGATVSGEKVSEEINTVNFGYIFGAYGTANNAEYVPATLESVTIYGGIIAANAFYGCSNLQNIVLGNSVMSIAQGAFNREMSLNSLTLPFVGESYDKTAFIGYIFGATEYKDNNKVLPRSLQTVAVTDNCNIIDYAFYGCENIVTVNIASSGETNGGIGKSAFAECVGLKTVTIKSGKFIDDSAFANCTSLTKVTVPDEIESFGNDVLQGCANIEYNNSIGIKYLDGDKEPYRVLIDGANIESLSVVTNVNTRIIAKNAFNGCSIEKITISENVVMIGDSAFANCAKLSAVDFATASSLKTIGQYAFANCTSITNIAIPDSVITISDNAFKGCSSLDKVNFGATSCLTGLGVGVFADCKALQNIVIPNTVTSIKKDLFINCSNLTSIVIPNAVIEIGDNAFKNCTNLSSVTFSEGSSLEIIGQSAFEGCGVLSVIALPDKVSSIGTRAFANCSMVTDLIIPANVTFVGDAAFEGCNAITNISMPTIAIEYISKDNLKMVVINGGENIGDKAFYSCSALTSVMIGNSVTDIGSYAFYNCTGLIDVYYSGDISSWCKLSFSSSYSNPMYYAENLYINGELLQGEITISDGVTSIGSYAFYECDSLLSVKIPDSVTSIGVRAFYNCSGLKDVYYDGNLEDWINIAFDYESTPMYYADNLYFNGEKLCGDIVIGNDAIKIPYGTFKNQKNITSITISKSITSIEGDAFYNCSGLKDVYYAGDVIDWLSIFFADYWSNPMRYAENIYYSEEISSGEIVIESGITEIPNGTFKNNNDITSIIIPSSVTYIGSNAFSNCKSLNSITFSENSKLNQIGDYAFKNCTNLTSITIPSSVTSIGVYAFSGCVNLKDVYYEGDIRGWCSISFGWFWGVWNGTNPMYYADNLYINGELLKGELIIPDGITRIRNYSFLNCTGLTSVVIPDGVTMIDEYAFYGCTNLTTITIPNSVEGIGVRAFNGCIKLTNVTIPQSVASIEKYAFSDCTKLESVIFDKNSCLESIEVGVFSNCNRLKGIIIPEGATSIGDYAFQMCVNLTSITIPSSIISLGFYAFAGCRSLTSITIPDSVTNMKSDVFLGCTNLTIYCEAAQKPIDWDNEWNNRGYNEPDYGYCPVVWDCNNNNVADNGYQYTVIDGLRYALKDSSAMIDRCYVEGEITIPSSIVYNERFYNVTNINDYAFFNCTNLSSITIPTSVISIGDNSFEGCNNIIKAIIPTTAIAYIPQDDLETVIINGGESIENYAFKNCTSLISIIIPSSVTNIGKYAFQNCSAEIIWGENPTITEIGEHAFSGYEGTSITIPDSVTEIGAYAFSDCIGLTSIIIPEQVTRIGEKILNRCHNLTVINYYAINVIEGVGNYPSNGLGTIGNSVIVNIGDQVGSIPAYLLSNLNVSILSLGNNVKIIGNYAFYNCTGLISITIPDSVTSIGKYAFDDFSAEIIWGENPTITEIGKSAFSGYEGTNITIPSSVTSIGNYAFYNCTRLISITIPDSVTSIGIYAFSGCTSLTNITISSGVTIIGGGAFAQCDGLKNIYYCGEITDWCNISFDMADTSSNPMSHAENLYINGEVLQGELIIPDSVTSIGAVAFSGCTGLTSIVIPDSVTSIESYAFSGCTGLTSIVIPDSVTSIESYAFFGCTGLTSVTIGDGVTSIEGWAFYGCTSLTSVTMGNSVTSIGDYAFYGCTSLTDVYYTGDIAGWCNIAFESGASNPMYYADNLFINGELLQGEITISDGVTSIGSYAFYNCTGLTSVTIDNGVTSIGNSAFYGCCNITKATIPTIAIGLIPKDDLQEVIINGGESIKSYAFSGCSSLTSVTIDYGVTSIGKYAFSNCASLTSITIPDSVTKIGEYAFDDCGAEIIWGENPTITEIGEHAFSGYEGTSLTIPSSVESIGTGAFNGCTSLKNVYYTGDIASWCNISFGSYDANPIYYAENLYIKGELIQGDLVIPDSVTGIGSFAFYGCTSLTSITIPDSVTNIGEWAFYNCTSLIDVYYTGDIAGWCNIVGFNWSSTPMEYASNLYINGELIQGDLIIPNGVTSIEDAVFWGCTGLTSIVIPNSIENIRDGAFYGCTGLTDIYYTGDMADWCNISFGSSAANPMCYAENLYINGELIQKELVIPDGVTGIKDYAFANCSSLTSIVIPNSVGSIGLGAFYGCTGLTSIVIPDSLESIGIMAFAGCSGLTDVYYTGDVAGWCNISFGSSDANPMCYAENLYINGELLQGELIIPDSVTSIGRYAFVHCNGLTNVTIGNSVTSIGYYAFYNCKGLTSATIGNSVTSIGESAFENCTGLTSITIPDSVTSIGSFVFYNCTRLTSVTIGDGLTSIGEMAFYHCTGLTNITFENTQGWQVSTSSNFSSYTELSSSDLADATIAATYLKDTYRNYYWRRVE